MILVKCKCGCFFSVKDSTVFSDDEVKRHDPIYFSCQNCNTNVTFLNTHELSKIIQQLKDANMEVQRIPDDSVIRVDYNI